jgi:hypothetical protein
MQPLLSFLKPKRSISPRQARDKQFINREISSKRTVPNTYCLSAGQDRLLLHAAPPRPQHHLARRFRRLRGLQNELVEPFLHKHDRFTKTGSGTSIGNVVEKEEFFRQAAKGGTAYIRSDAVCGADGNAKFLNCGAKNAFLEPF